MANAFLRGFNNARQERDRRRAADTLDAQRQQALEASNFELQRAGVGAQRNDKAFNANLEEFGAQAGDPTATGQLVGIQQRRELAPFALREAQTNEDQAAADRLKAAQVNALQAVRKGVAGGVSAADTLSNLPPSFRQATGLTDEVVGELATAIDAEPGLADAMLEGLTGPRTGSTGRIRTLEGTDANGKRIAVVINPNDPSNPTTVPGFTPDNAFANKVVGSEIVSGNADADTIRNVSGQLATGAASTASGRAARKSVGGNCS